MQALVAVFLLVSLAALPGFAQTNVMLKTRSTFRSETAQGTVAGRRYTTTIYIAGDRQRFEQEFEAYGPAPNHSFAYVYRCDTGQRIMLNDRAHTYAVFPFGPKYEQECREKLLAKVKAGKIKPIPLDPKAGVLTITFDTKDTGERREVNGVILRHLTELQTYEYSVPPMPSETVRIEHDGWYVDLPQPGACSKPDNPTTTFAFLDAGPARHQLKINRVGEKNLRLGRPAIETATTVMANGSRMVTTTELVELSQAPIDPKLFDIPASYSKAQQLPHGGVDMEHASSTVGTLRAWWNDLWRR